MLTISPGDVLLPVPTAVEKAIGYRPHPTTCTRWTRHGVRGLKLATVVVGGRPRTTVAAVIAFDEAQTANTAATSLEAQNSGPPR
jgi:hypothetical protein